MIFRAERKNLFWKEIASESNTVLVSCFDSLDALGYAFKSFTIDGRRGAIQFLQERYPNVPIQLCLFHQQQIVRRATTLRPKTPCGQELRLLSLSITKLDKPTFAKALQGIKAKYRAFLKECNENNQYQHRKLRSAIRSLTTNLPFLFTFQDHPSLTIPPTTNSCDGYFSHFKHKIRSHRGISRENRKKMIDYLLSEQ